jgi:polyphosphate kinase 2 (PPK2 family)
VVEEFFDHGAVCDIEFLAGIDMLEFALEGLKFFDEFSDFAEMLFSDGVDIVAWFFGVSAKGEQLSDIVYRES